MKIRTQFILTLSVFGLILIGMAASLLLTSREIDRLDKQVAIADRTAQGAVDLSYIAGDYLMYGESQHRARWETRFASFSEDLARLTPANLGQQAHVDYIQSDQARLRAVFADVVATIEGAASTSGSAPDPAFSQVSWSRVEVQNQAIAFEASQLSEKLHAQAELLEHINLTLILALIGAFGAYLLATFYLIYPRILRSLADLQAGAAIVGSGRLDFTIAEKRTDEIGQLTRAFNQMTRSLKAVTASKAELEHEIAERKDIEDRLKESENHYRGLFEHMAEGLAYCQMVFENDTPSDWVYLAVNDAFETLTALKDAAGKRVSELIPGLRETDPALFHIYGRVALTGQPERFEMFVEALQSWFSVSVYSPKPGYFVAVFDVITERKRAEEVLRQAHDELEMRVRERTVQLEEANAVLEEEIDERKRAEGEIHRLNQDLEGALAKEKSMREQLIQAEKLSALGRMVGSVAHELNNPLQTITNCLYLTDQELAADSPIHTYLEMAQAETQRIVSLVAQLRELYRMRPSGESQALLVDELLFDVQALMAASLESAHVRWQRPEALADCRVKAMPDRLKQVFINLATNAIQAMQPAGGVLRVDLVPSSDGQQIGVSFYDTGPGILPEHIGRLFEPFFTTKPQGLGLGLPICHEIVQQHGGQITVTSQPGQGAQFIVWLPLAPADKA